MLKERKKRKRGDGHDLLFNKNDYFCYYYSSSIKNVKEKLFAGGNISILAPYLFFRDDLVI